MGIYLMLKIIRQDRRIRMSHIVRILMALFIFIILSPLVAHAHGAHGYYRGGVWINPFWVAPYPYYSIYPYYSAPEVIVERPAPDYYVQPAPQRPEEPAYWYYCRKPEGYYPYVKQCPDGWMKVVPAPPLNK
jgi:hypothetical protein